MDNGPTADVVVWSVLSLIVLLGGTGGLFAVYGRWSQQIGWHSAEAPVISFRQPDEVVPHPGSAGHRVVLLHHRRAVPDPGRARWGLTEHYRADTSSFFGIDLAELLPFNLARTWHVQLSLFWTAAGFLAAGIFLTPFIAGREPKRQATLVYILFGAVVLVVVGSLLSEGLSIHGVSWAKGPLFAQQWEYLDLPRVWQILLTAGMFIWILIIFRGIRARLKNESKGNMPWLFFFSALAIPAFYAVGMLATTGTHLSVAEFWRFWVVHLWVEDFLELFTTVMVAYIFVMLGVVRERIAVGVIFLDVILYSADGAIGTMHHLYFSGTPVEHMALGAFFSAAEVIPLTFLTIEAWTFLQLGSRQESRSHGGAFPHPWAVMFLVAVGFWNFVGAGIFGFLVNLPIVSCFEIGTALTANHAHGSMMGVYGMLAVGLAMFALRYLIPADKWPERLAKLSFWGLNIGLAWMVFAALLPLGIRQLYASVTQGYFEARSLNYLAGAGNKLLEWGRMPRRRDPHRGGLPAVPLHRRPRAAVRAIPADHPRVAAGRVTVHRAAADQRRRVAIRLMFSTNVLLVCGYSAFLLAVAYGSDLMARRVAVRAQRWRTGSFRYHADHDAWTCPEDQWLWPASFDPEQRIVRYRAKPSVCNSCPVKDTCTTSGVGREVSRELDPWPHSEAGRFHRGLACCIAVMAVFFPLGMLLSGPTAPEILLLLGVAAVVAVGAVPLARHLWRSPSNFPDHIPQTAIYEIRRDRFGTRWGSFGDREAEPLSPKEKT